MEASVEVQVPDGLFAGDTFTVQHDGLDFDVVVPEGCAGGTLLTVDVPAPPDAGNAVEVEVPSECVPGDVFVMATAEGLELDVVVPDGCFGGDVITVDLPPPEGPPSNPGSRRPSLGRRASNNGRDGRRPSNGARRPSLSSGESSPSASNPPPPLVPPHMVPGAAVDSSRPANRSRRNGIIGSSSVTSDAPSSSSAGATKKGIQFGLSLGNGLSLNLSLCTQGKYKVGSQIEVYRSDGSWSRSQIKVCATSLAAPPEAPEAQCALTHAP